MSWKIFKSGSTVNTEYLNPIPNPESRKPNSGECAKNIQATLQMN